MSRSIVRRNVVVVGGAGFIGSHVVEHLLRDRQCKVLVVDNLSAGRREFVPPDADFRHLDITGSESEILKTFRAFGAEFVLNYAAEPYIPVSFERPLHVFSLNAMGALKVINAAQEAGCEGILQVSSAEIYGEGGLRITTDEDGPKTYGETTGKINEHCKVVPHSTYGAAKAAIDALIQVRWREARTPCIALRQFNCVGERETHPYVIPEIIGQLDKARSLCSAAGLEGDNLDNPIVRLGNDSFRDFQYAGDAARMAVELLEKGEFGEVYNMGSETGTRIYDLARTLGRLMGFPNVTVIKDPARVRPWEIWHLQADNAKLYSVIEARPTVDLEESLRRTVDWYRSVGCRWPWEA